MKHPVYGVVAEFKSPAELVAAARATREAGYTRFEGYAPYPIEELSEAIGYGKSRLPGLVFLGGLAGFLIGYGMQWYISVYYYPINIGGRPLNSWPAFIPVTFECTILGAVLTAVFGMLALNGLPMPYHPLFHVPRFAARASRDLFFLCIQSRDPKFDRAAVGDFLRGMNPSDVQEVPH
jgi:Alternative complex III, ActD subunit